MLVSIKHLNHSLSLKLSARCLEPPNNIPLAKYIFLAVVTSRTLSNNVVHGPISIMLDIRGYCSCSGQWCGLL